MKKLETTGLIINILIQVTINNFKTFNIHIIKKMALAQVIAHKIYHRKSTSLVNPNTDNK